MAEENEIFHTLKDANGDGEAPDLREEGQAEGDAKSHAILPAKDIDNNTLEYLPMKKGALVITDDGAGTEVGGANSGTVTTPGSTETAAEVTLGAANTYSNIEVGGSSFKDCWWQLVYVDDADGTPAESLIIEFRTGAGAYSFRDQIKNFTQDTTGGTGTQKLRLYINQRAGTGSNFSTEIRAIEN